MMENPIRRIILPTCQRMELLFITTSNIPPRPDLSTKAETRRSMDRAGKAVLQLVRSNKIRLAYYEIWVGSGRCDTTAVCI
mmetsp:Transcript_24423/g.57903  ORF Transcript_24423/g.57903 Transcript_24423/m.57903 type:complete len:81 (+) Transcript_24423:1681-1923(+)